MLAVACALVPAPARAASCPARGLALLVETGQHRLWTCENGRATGEYAVALGSGGVGKTRRGDAKVPLGDYALGTPRGSSQFHTFIPVGYPTAEQRRLWEQVRRGQDIAMSAARLGATAGSVDDAVRRSYEKWGYGPGYALPGLSHRTGHGIGMEGHEPVNLVHGEATKLASGMCFSKAASIASRRARYSLRSRGNCVVSTPRWTSSSARHFAAALRIARDRLG